VPTYEWAELFAHDLKRLTAVQRAAFEAAVGAFVADLRVGRGFRKGLRVKRVQGHPHVFELTWAPDGRATWQYGDEQRDGEAHIVWRRVGTHKIFDRP
jgi:hypothetical protein